MAAPPMPEATSWVVKATKWWTDLLSLDMDEWLEEKRGNLMVVTVMIATIAIQNQNNPPGGVLNAEKSNQGFFNNAATCVDVYAAGDAGLCPGESILAVRASDYYFYYFIFNLISLYASLIALAIFVSGIRLRNIFLVWILSILNVIAVISLGFSSIFSVLMMTPKRLLIQTGQFRYAMTFARIMFSLIVTINLVAFIIWLMRNGNKIINRIKTPPAGPTRARVIEV